MGLVDGTLVKMYDANELGAEIDRYSDLSDKARAGTIKTTERKELYSMRKHLAV